MPSQPFRDDSAFNRTRMGEVFAGMEARADKMTPAECEADKTIAQMMVAGTFFIEYLQGSIALGKISEKSVSETLSASFDRYIQFIALIRPDWFATPEMAEKTRKTFLMVYNDLRDAASRKI